MKHNTRAMMDDPHLPKLDSGPIKEVLQEAMPKIALSKAGRLRLVHALTFKYGENFRNFEAPMKALDHFDSEYNHVKTYLKIKGHIRGERR